MRVAAPSANIASTLENCEQALQMQRIEFRFHNDATPASEFHAQTAARRCRIDQFHRDQLFGSRNRTANTIPVAIIVQGVQCHSAGCAEWLPRQPALLKIPYQPFRFSLAPMTSR
jgi:hypothetical protein